MQPSDDSTLLRQFADHQSHDAFAALVSRHINLVYSVAHRQSGNSHHAEEITQAVFVILAKKAAQLRHDKALSSWLFQTTRLTANNFIRGEMRRLHREQEAYMQSILNAPEGDAWPQIAPLLDGAVASLREKDRQAILLRFYEGRNLREVGEALGASEDAAEKRVTRALEKLRRFFSKRGIDSTTTALAGAISANAIQIPPLTLTKAVTTVAITKGAAASNSTLTLIHGALKTMAWTKAKTSIAGAAILLIVTTGAVVVKEQFFPTEPGYQGRSLDEWLADIDYRQPQDKRTAAANAIRQMGVHTVPYLLADLGDRNFKTYARKNDQRTVDQLNNEASWAFDALGPAAKSAIPELTTILEQNPGYVASALAGIGLDALPVLLSALTNQDFWVRDNSAAALANAIFAQKITPDEASPAFPIALSNLTYTSTNMMYQVNTRDRAAWLLAALQESPDVTVPALIRGMGDSSYTVAADCAFALGEFGKQSKPAIQSLTEAANSTNIQLSMMAKQALTQIERAQIYVKDNYIAVPAR